MIHKSLHLLVPNQKPFDKENWFEPFVGNFVIPVIETGKIYQYWFSRYGGPGAWQVRFRFSLDDYGEVEPLVDKLLKNWSLTNLKDEEDYTWTNDLGGERFLQNNRRQCSKNHRAQLVFDYLNAISRLFVDSLSHSDQNGYFFQETNTNINNIFGSIFESLHHLFCNVTNVATVVLEGEIDGKPAFEGSMYFNNACYTIVLPFRGKGARAWSARS